MKPYDDDAGSSALNHDFWCAQFELARWVCPVAAAVPGCTVAHAVRTARETIRKAAPHNPTWLAYSLYAHPNSHVSVNK